MNGRRQVAKFTIREARCADVEGIVRVHVESWRTTYRGILPGDYLANIDVPARKALWKQVLCSGDTRAFVFVAERRDGDIVGFASGGPVHGGHAEYPCELHAIYLLEPYQRHGLGRRLLTAAVHRLQAGGFDAMMLWVLAANPSRRFYEAMGGQVVTTVIAHVGGVDLEEVAYGWKGLSHWRDA